MTQLCGLCYINYEGNKDTCVETFNVEGNMVEAEKQRLHVAISKKLHVLLKVMAAKRNISMALLVERAVARYIKKDIDQTQK